jgi:hypothetical protein
MCIYFLLGAVCVVLIILGVWWLALLAGPAIIAIREIKDETTIDTEGEAKAQQIHESGGLQGVAMRIMELLGKGSADEGQK